MANSETNLDYSSDEEISDDFVCYKDRPEWSDVTPIPQDDGPYPVVAIQYSPQFEDTFNYFRAVLKSKEISERALQLTSDCIRFNASNYTVWYYRRMIYDNLDKNLCEELSFIEATIMKSQKNYQVWEHYRYVLEKLKEKVDQNQLEDYDLQKLTSNFKSFIRTVLKFDTKNYHAWQLLQWINKSWNQWEGELQYTEKLIDDDIRNNSAWNHRFYIFYNTSGFTDSIVFDEVNFTLKMIVLAPNNESAWNYLSGLMKVSTKPIHSFQSLIDTCDKLNSDSSTRTSFLVSFIISYCYQQLQLMNDDGISIEDEKYNLIYTKAIESCDLLATSIDTLREKYWKYRAESIRQKFGPVNNN